MFTVFLIVAAWQLGEVLPEWLKVCITVFGVLHIIFGTTTRIVHEYHDKR